jgi:anaerobic ribonucleoside-triphosphate reductase activating protein
MHNIKIHAILSNSQVNGPGSRTVIWTQGCSKGCKGCFNPETWPEKGIDYNIDDFYYMIKSQIESGDNGITFTGGDPLEQPEALYHLLKKINDELLDNLPFGIILFTGYTLSEIINLDNDYALKCLDLIDLLIDGRFEQDHKIIDKLAGSSNQKFHFSCINGRGESRIPRESVVMDQAVEIHEAYLGDDVFHITGFPRIDRVFLLKKGIEIK